MPQRYSLFVVITVLSNWLTKDDQHLQLISTPFYWVGCTCKRGQNEKRARSFYKNYIVLAT